MIFMSSNDVVDLLALWGFLFFGMGWACCGTWLYHCQRRKKD
jgi:hypothetical protein